MAAEDGAAPTTPDSGILTTPPTAPEVPTDWRTSLTNEWAPLAKEKSLESFKGATRDEVFPHIVKAFIDTKKMVGAKTDGMVKLPGKDAKPEDVAAYRAAIGVPKAPSDYDVKLPADAPEGMAIDPERFAGYAKAFHEMNLTNDQVNGIVGWALREEGKRAGQQREQYATALDGLAETWGVDVFNRRAGEVQALVRRYADPETLAWLDQSGLTNHPGLFKMLYPIARQFVDDEIIEGVGDSKTGDLASLDQRLEANREAYLKAPEGSPARMTLLDERERLLNLRGEVVGTR